MNSTAETGTEAIRPLGFYRYFRESEPDFTPSDAISLALHLHRERGYGNDSTTGFYERAYSAVCTGLGLEQHDLGRLGDWGQSLPCPLAPAIDDDEGPESAALALRQLLRLRTQMMGFCDEWGSVLEGDIWGRRAAHPELERQLRQARAWYSAMRGEMERGIESFDAALCTLLCWNPEARISFDRLKDEFGFPDEEWCD